MVRVAVSPDMLRWARERAGLTAVDLVGRFPKLLDCQQRQGWYRDHARLHALDQVDFVGSAGLADGPEVVAEAIRLRLGFDLEARRACPTWEDALRQFITLADDAGVMVMCSGVVANNNHRGLDPEEFRGFALADALAPVVFINGADTKSAQMFTLAAAQAPPKTMCQPMPKIARSAKTWLT